MSRGRPSTGRCKVCDHRQRGAIERELIDPQRSNRAIAKTYGLVARTLDRHKLKCVRLAAVATIERQERKLAVDLVDGMEALQSVTMGIMRDALEGVPLLNRKNGEPILDKRGRAVLVRDGRTALRAVREGRGNYQLLAQLTGKLEAPESGAARIITYEELVAIWKQRRTTEVRV